MYESDGLFAVDLIAEGINDKDISGFNIEVDYDDDVLTVDQTLTSGSLLATLTSAFNITYGANKVVLSGTNGSFCNGIAATGFSPVALFTVFFSGTPGECSDLEINPAGIFFVPTSTTWSSCIGSVDISCEYEFCVPEVDISGNIESPAQDCDGSFDHGVPEVVIDIVDLDEVEEFDCATETDNYGDYMCNVAEGRSYRISPSKDDNPGCGLSSLDLDILQEHLLGVECIEENWQLIAGDADFTGNLGVLDIVTINKVILELDLSMQSWTFVPTSEYVLFDEPDCEDPPSYTPYIDILDIDDDEDAQDFVGIKVGDLNGSCTDCNGRQQPASSVAMGHQKNAQGQWEYFFDKDITDLGVYFLELKLPSKLEHIEVTSLLPGAIMDYAVRGKFLRISYVNMIAGGEHIKAYQPVLTLYSDELLNQAPEIPAMSRSEFVSKSIGVVRIMEGEADRNVVAPFDPYDVVITAYPNPVTNGEFYLDLGTSQVIGGELAVFNGHGTCVFRVKLPDQGVFKVDLNDLPKGVYFWMVMNVRESSSMGRIIVQ